MYLPAPFSQRLEERTVEVPLDGLGQGGWIVWLAQETCPAVDDVFS